MDSVGRGRDASENKVAFAKRTRTIMSPSQNDLLMRFFAVNPFPTTDVRKELAKSLHITPRTVQIWFQNQRQKAKHRSEYGMHSGIYPLYTNFSIPNHEPTNSLKVLADVAYDEYCRFHLERETA